MAQRSRHYSGQALESTSGFEQLTASLRGRRGLWLVAVRGADRPGQANFGRFAP